MGVLLFSKREVILYKSMGTRGRDIFLWAFFLSALIYIGAWILGWRLITLSCTFMFTGVLSLWYYPYEFLSRKKSRKNGLYHVVLLRLWPWWAKFLIQMSGGRIEARIIKAYEVHVITPKGIGLGDFLKALDRDLKLAEREYPGTLFMWETTAPLPSHIRTLIRTKTEKGQAFWKKGEWPVPRFISSKKNGTIRHGFIITEGVIKK
jgi:hypothetical protein